MKAKDLLQLFCHENVSLESGIDYITIDEYFDFETFFWCKISCPCFLWRLRLFVV